MRNNLSLAHNIQIFLNSPVTKLGYQKSNLENGLSRLFQRRSSRLCRSSRDRRDNPWYQNLHRRQHRLLYAQYHQRRKINNYLRHRRLWLQTHQQQTPRRLLCDQDRIPRSHARHHARRGRVNLGAHPDRNSQNGAEMVGYPGPFPTPHSAGPNAISLCAVPFPRCARRAADSCVCATSQGVATSGGKVGRGGILCRGHVHDEIGHGGGGGGGEGGAC